jgi:16S rRNA (guanine527-N7)-methyltransferase
MAEDGIAPETLALARRWQSTSETEGLRRLDRFCARLLEWNARINLTGARDLATLREEHLPDAFAMAQVVPAGSAVIDVGSGGGLPAVPFACLRPDCAVTLVEPRAKRTAFLRTVTRELGTPTTVVEGRLEALDPDQHRHDVASSRATFAPEEWLALAPRLVRPGGLVLVFTTPEIASKLPPSSDGPLVYGGRALVTFRTP